MKELAKEEMREIGGGGVSAGKLVTAMVGGALTGALRGIAGGPLMMIGQAVAGAGMGAYMVASYDAANLYVENQQNDDFIGI